MSLSRRSLSGLLLPPALLGGARRAAAGPVPRPRIEIAPREPPEFPSLPAAWSPTVAVAGVARVRWAVLQAPADGTPRWTAAEPLREVDIPGGGGSFAPDCLMRSPRDRLVVVAADGSARGVSGPAVAKPPPSPAAVGPAMARAFVSDLALGVNVERAQAIWNGWITAAQLREYKGQGITHVRFFPPVRPDWGGFPDPAGGGIDYLLDAAERAMGAGLKVHVDLLDVMSSSGMADGRVMPYLRAAARRIRRRNWDVSRYALGAANEYAGGTNAEHRGKMHEATAALRAELPDALLVVASGYWGAPGHLTDGTFVPPRDGRILVQWHCYDPDAADVRSCERWQERISAWAASNGLVTYCGEWGVGPPDNSTGAADLRSEFPKHIDAAARGMGQQRPTFWTVTTGGWWRLNQDNSAALRPDVAAAFAAGSRHIARQPWFQRV